MSGAFDNTVLFAPMKQAGGSISLSSSALTVQFAGSESVVFDLSNSADRLFAMELAGLDRLLMDLSSVSPSSSSPHLYSIATLGLQAMIEQHGASNQLTLTAAHLLDIAIQQTLAHLESLYPGQFTAQIVLMGSPSTSTTSRDAIISTLRSHLHAEVDAKETFPVLFAKDSSSTNALCDLAKATASEHGLRAECVSQLTRPVLLQQKSSSGAKQNNAQPSQQDVVDYQIFLWVWFLMLLVLISALYPLFYMDITGGIFSSFLFAKKYV